MKEIVLLVNEDCKHCEALEGFMDDKEVQKTIARHGIDKVRVVNSNSEEGDRLYNDEVKDKLGVPFKVAPVTLVKNNDEVEWFHMGYGDDYGRKLGRNIGIDQKAIDKVSNVKNALSRIFKRFKP